MAKKQSKLQIGDLFKMASVPQINPPTRVIDSPPLADPTCCPRCGGRSLQSVRPREMGGTHYCVRCAVDGEPLYFTLESAR